MTSPNENQDLYDQHALDRMMDEGGPFQEIIKDRTKVGAICQEKGDTKGEQNNPEEKDRKVGLGQDGVSGE